VSDNWQATYGERFLARAIQRPQPEPIYVPPTDEQIALLPEGQRRFALTVRAWHYAMAEAGKTLSEAFRQTALTALVSPAADREHRE